MATQLTSATSYIHQQKLVHRVSVVQGFSLTVYANECAQDLAARNVLVASISPPKAMVSDFGLARTVISNEGNEYYYRQVGCFGYCAVLGLIWLVQAIKCCISLSMDELGKLACPQVHQC